MGQYDVVAVCEAPDDETMARLSLIGGSRGFTRSETMRAFTESEYLDLMTALP